MVKTLIVLSLLSVGSAFTTVRSSVPRARLQMGLDPVLAKSFPRDFKTIPKGTDYGAGTDEKLNNDVESRRLDYLEKDLLQRGGLQGPRGLLLQVRTGMVWIGVRRNPVR